MSDINIGKRLRSILDENGISVVDFAGMLHKSTPYVYTIFKQSHINTELLQEISSLLNVPITTFFEDAPRTVHKERIKQGGSGNVNSVVKGNNFFSNKDEELTELRNKIIALEAQNKMLVDLIEKFGLIPGKSMGEIDAEREKKKQAQKPSRSGSKKG